MFFNKKTKEQITENKEQALVKINNPLRKLRRKQLLELLLEASEENERLKKENEMLREKYQDKVEILKDSGSLAEASLKLTNIFEEAQKAVDIYMDNVITSKEVSDNIIEKDENEKYKWDTIENEFEEMDNTTVEKKYTSAEKFNKNDNLNQTSAKVYNQNESEHQTENYVAEARNGRHMKKTWEFWKKNSS